MSVFAKFVVLSFHHTRQRTHEDAAFPGQVGVHFLFEGGREEIARADGNTECNRTLLSATGRILMDGEAGIDAGAFEEVDSHTAPGSLGGNQRHVHMRRRDHAGIILERDGESVREVKHIAFVEMFHNAGPLRTLTGIG